MASNSAEDCVIPLSLPLESDGQVRLPETLLSLKFNFRVGIMYVMKEMEDGTGTIC